MKYIYILCLLVSVVACGSGEEAVEDSSFLPKPLAIGVQEPTPDLPESITIASYEVQTQTDSAISEETQSTAESNNAD